MAYTYTDNTSSATMDNGSNDTDWKNLCTDLSNNKIKSIYFHYADYSYQGQQENLLIDITKATDLTLIILKNSFFTFQNENESHGLKTLLEVLQIQVNLEHLQIRNYDSEDLDIIFENLPALLQTNKSIKKLSFEHEDINSKKFRLLCNQLSMIDRKFELELKWYINLSKENKFFLKKALERNPLVTVLPDSLQEELKAAHRVDYNLNFLLLSGSILAGGIITVIIAFTLLNAAALGATTVFTAGIGTASILTGIGLFAYDYYTKYENESNFSPHHP